MSNNTGAGLGDPYWYEWSVGQSYVIDMLDPGSKIVSVTLQKTGEKGLDDVVVRYGGGDTLFIQVKHTRAEDTLTFGDFVESGDDKPSLLRQLATAWKVESAQVEGRCEVRLVTNRAASVRRSSTKGPAAVQRPPLAAFLAHLATAITADTTDVAAVAIPPDWQRAWKLEWLPQLEALGAGAQIVNFLRCFRVESTDQGLEAAATALDAKLMSLFVVNANVAQRLRSRLDSALREWATSARGNADAARRKDCVRRSAAPRRSPRSATP